MMNALFVFPGDINQPTGGYRYNRIIIEQLNLFGITVQPLSLKGKYPFPSKEDERAALLQLEKLPTHDIAIVDGLAGGAMPQFLEKLSQKMPVIALIHHPLCLETGLDEKAAKKLQSTEHDGLKYVSKIITTSEITSTSVANIFQQSKEKIEAVLPGVRDIGISGGSDGTETKLLCVASITERKNHITLLSALNKLTTLKWHLDCIGMTNADEELFAKLQAQTIEMELEKHVTFHGALEEQSLNAAYLNADIFVLPSHFEGYGMVYSEAIMCGLPIIASNAGAIPDTVPKACGILIEPSDEQALTKALHDMMSNKSIRDQYKQACIAQRKSFSTWSQSAQHFANILKETK